MRIRSLALHWQIIIGLVLGTVYAIFSSSFGWVHFTSMWIAPWGDIFISLLKLVAVPLVLFSIISGINSLGDPKQLGKMGAKTLAIYIATTILAISTGLIAANMIRPGDRISDEMQMSNRITYELWAKKEGIPIHDKKCITCSDDFQYSNNATLDSTLLNNALPTESSIETERTPLTFIQELIPSNIFQTLADEKSMLKVIFFAVFFGVALLLIPSSKKDKLSSVIDTLSDVFIKMVELIMRAAPFFVFALMAGVIAEQAGDDPKKVIELFKGLGWYALSVVSGLLFVAFLVYPFVVKFFIKGVSFKQFIKSISPAQLLAFSTSSSAATLPVTMDCVEKNLNVDNRVASFVLPIGATVNMDGTSLYQSVAVIFLAQLHGIDLDIIQQLSVILTVVLASIGSAAVPSAGIVMLMIVLTSVGLNPAWISIILPIDRILDMCRTSVNVTGDALVSLIVDRTSKL